jgi:predicted dinucleotide-binding enzyme
VSGSGVTDARLGIIGAGKIGTAIARAAVVGGYDVDISGSGDAERIRLIVEVLAPGAHAVTTEEVARFADLIVLAVPMHRFRELPNDLFDGKILVDAMNYWEEIDGVDEELASAPTGTSVVVQRHFAAARVVKSLNHLGYFKFSQGRSARGTPDRIAMAVAGNDVDAVGAVMRLVDRLGFDGVATGSLEAGIMLQPGEPAFAVGYTVGNLTKLLFPEKPS